MNRNITIIAELAQGFEGDYSQSRLLIRAAASARADIAKFQLVYADELATPDYKYYDLFKSLEMPDTDWQKLAAYAKDLGIEISFDIFGLKSLRLSESLGITVVKIHGTDIANIGLLTAVSGSSVRTIILGAGGAHLSEIETALSVLQNKEVIILLGYQGYPTPDDENQISRLPILKNYLETKYTNISLGFADHADPDNPLKYALAASALGAGAVFIEKHLTLGKCMKLEDHESALNPDNFLEFTNVIRKCNSAIGKATLSDDFSMCEAEKSYRTMIRRHVVAAHDLAKGTLVNPADVVLKRTSSEQVFTDPGVVYGKTIARDIKGNSAILKTDLA